MRIFLYLEKKEWANTWIEGGLIKVKRASAYFKTDRDGIYTPDENVQRTYRGGIFEAAKNPIFDMKDSKSTVKINNCGFQGPNTIPSSSMFILEEGAHATFENIGFAIKGAHSDMKPISYDQTWEDVFIMCFSTKLSYEIQQKLKKVTCIEILNFSALKSSLDDQFKVKSMFDLCRYTLKNKRNHFLKSQEDQWQKEARLVWKIDGSDLESMDTFLVEIPPGIGKEIILSK